MIFKVVRPVDINVKYLDVYCGSRVHAEDFSIGENYYDTLEDVWKEFPALKNATNEVYLRIDVETGEVVNWPKGYTGCFMSCKVVDEGIYVLIDNDNNIIVEHSGYVPDCLAIESEGYGDYFEFTIDNTGHIDNWKFSQYNVDEFFPESYD